MKALTIMVAVVLGVACACASAESLWTNESKSMTADRRARAIGDILTVIVVESAGSSQKASTDWSKEVELGSDNGIGPLIKQLPQFGFSGNQSSQATGSTSRSSNLVAKITVRVKNVLPNGNLEIEGTRDVQTDNEKQSIVLSGTVRQEDVSSDNTVLSTYIADAKITHRGTGTIGARMKEGIITRIFRILF